MSMTILGSSADQAAEAVAAALVEQNWSWFAVDERKPILDAMLYAMDRDAASALEAFILTQQEPAE